MAKPFTGDMEITLDLLSRTGSAKAAAFKCDELISSGVDLSEERKQDWCNKAGLYDIIHQLDPLDEDFPLHLDSVKYMLHDASMVRFLAQKKDAILLLDMTQYLKRRIVYADPQWPSNISIQLPGAQAFLTKPLRRALLAMKDDTRFTSDLAFLVKQSFRLVFSYDTVLLRDLDEALPELKHCRPLMDALELSREVVAHIVNDHRRYGENPNFPSTLHVFKALEKMVSDNPQEGERIIENMVYHACKAKGFLSLYDEFRRDRTIVPQAHDDYETPDPVAALVKTVQTVNPYYAMLHSLTPGGFNTLAGVQYASRSPSQRALYSFGQLARVTDDDILSLCVFSGDAHFRQKVTNEMQTWWKEQKKGQLKAIDYFDRYSSPYDFDDLKAGVLELIADDLQTLRNNSPSDLIRQALARLDQVFMLPKDMLTMADRNVPRLSGNVDLFPAIDASKTYEQVTH